MRPAQGFPPSTWAPIGPIPASTPGPTRATFAAVPYIPYIPRSRSNNIRRNILLAFLKCPIKIADTFRPYFFGIPYKSRAVIPHAIAASSWLFLQPLLKAPTPVPVPVPYCTPSSDQHSRGYRGRSGEEWKWQPSDFGSLAIRKFFFTPVFLWCGGYVGSFCWRHRLSPFCVRWSKPNLKNHPLGSDLPPFSHACVCWPTNAHSPASLLGAGDYLKLQKFHSLRKSWGREAYVNGKYMCPGQINQ